MARKPTAEVQLKLRFTEALRRRLAKEAAANEHSMNAEIIDRLDRSFALSERLEELFGSDRNVRLFRSLTAAIEATERQSGQPWNDDADTAAEVRLAAIALLKLQATNWQMARALQKLPPKSETEMLADVMSEVRGNREIAEFLGLRKIDKQGEKS
jgi:hypothetical protein